MRGYYAALKSCLAGLTLVSDMSVTCFLQGGQMINIMIYAAEFRNKEAFLRECQSPAGLSERAKNRINDVIKNAKIKLIHIGHSRKARELGPPSNHPDSCFDFEGKRVTVAEYFSILCRDKSRGTSYLKALPDCKLIYPEIPTINIGTSKKPVLVPPELVVVLDGQCRIGACTGDMTASLIRFIYFISICLTIPISTTYTC
jgi:hypothetical protein